MKKSASTLKQLSDKTLYYPLIIAGPCSAETEEQTLQTAHQLKDSKTTVFRAGIWKPRTRPGSFEGVGKVGLPWLKRVKEETGLLIAIEVANKTHVELALKADIDILWIGARSTVSPFIVQEIADALQGTDKTIMVKNPVSPDLSLWIGAIERLQGAGIKSIAAIHRGFSTYIKTEYRNNPEWQIALDFHQKFSEIPLILDPSHIAGRRDLIAGLCQTAFDLNYDGLMVETHINPDKAWSDAEQQLTPKAFLKMLQEISKRHSGNEEIDFVKKISSLRTQIDNLDSQIINALVNRMYISEKIGVLKKQNNVSIIQTERWKKVLENMKKTAKKSNLSETFIEEIFKSIHQESIEQQRHLKDN